jgi:hypothetical protein
MTSIEIQVFAMYGDRIAERGELVDYYDIVVRDEADDNGEIRVIEQIDDLTLEAASELVDLLEYQYETCAEWVGGDN